jgi:hypothetical protein
VIEPGGNIERGQARGLPWRTIIGIAIVLAATAAGTAYGGLLDKAAGDAATAACDAIGGHLTWQPALRAGWLCDAGPASVFLPWRPGAVPTPIPTSLD